MPHPPSSIVPDRNRPTLPADTSFARGLFERLDPARSDTVIAAVSGGSDSVALLLLLKSYLADRPGAPRIRAVTIDHGLRPEAGEEARGVGALCASIGVAHETRRWDGPKPVTGIMAAAREARHKLLADAAKAHGAQIVLTGHTLDDQIETVMMQGQRHAGPAAGMAPATLYEQSVWFARPLLRQRRETLRDWLESRQIGWIDDPSNMDRRYERVRVREVMRSLAPDEFARLAQAAGAAGDDRARRAGELAETIRDHLEAAWPGLFSLPAGIVLEADEPAIELVRLVAGVAGGLRHFPPRERVAAFLAALARPGARASLGRAIATHQAGRLHFHREARGLPQPQSVTDGLLWDGRFRLRLNVPHDMRDVRIQVAGMPRKRDAADGEREPHLARLAAATLPIVTRSGRSLGGRELMREGICVEPAIGAWSRYLPLFDLPAAWALARRIGAIVPPRSPWRDHNEALTNETA